MNKKILVVEDDKILQKAIREALLSEKYEVFVASDGGEAKQMIRLVKYDFILLDIILPVLDGFQLLKLIRSSRKNCLKNIPIIMLTNLGQDEDVNKAMQMGANGYLVKLDFSTEEIIKNIKSLLLE